MSTTPQSKAEQVTTTALALIQPELEALDDWTIESVDDSEFAAEMLRDVKARHKALETERLKIAGPLTAASKAVNALFKPPRTLLERAEKRLKNAIAAYIESNAESNTATLEAVAEAESPEDAAALLATVEHASAPAGVSVRYKWRAEVFSPGIVPDSMRTPDLAVIQAYTDEAVKIHGEPTPIPGVRFEKEPIVSSRAVKS